MDVGWPEARENDWMAEAVFCSELDKNERNDRGLKKGYSTGVVEMKVGVIVELV